MLLLEIGTIYTRQKVKYHIGLLQFFGSLIIMLYFSIYDMALMIFVKHSAAQLQLLGSEMNRKDEKYFYSTEIVPLDVKDKNDRMQAAVKKHQDIIRFIQQINKTFSTVLFVQILISVILLCMTELQLLMVRMVTIRLLENDYTLCLN